MTLYCFDVDGTLVTAWTANLLPGVAEWFAKLDQRDGDRVAFITNQGGVGLRQWMETEDWGEPEKLPTEADVYRRLDSTAAQLGIADTVCTLTSFAYQTKAGQWSPDPGGPLPGRQWLRNWRKPRGGMIEAAMADNQIFKNVVVIGDSDDDRRAAAAAAAGVAFEWAAEFFGRSE